MCLPRLGVFGATLSTAWDNPSEESEHIVFLASPSAAHTVEVSNLGVPDVWSSLPLLLLNSSGLEKKSFFLLLIFKNPK